ncbi:MAG TPA: FliI/YscN family ATPase [Rhodanobacteraceae bacterium]|nr:FliI/YscN family ATPase [Rhodanobacteraceae bacterium]
MASPQTSRRDAQNFEVRSSKFEVDSSSALTISLKKYFSRLSRTEPAPVVGQVTRVVGLLVESNGPAASVGEICEVRTGRAAPLPVEVVGFRDGRLLSVPLGDTAGIRPGDPIVARGDSLTVPVGDALLGRVIDGLGRPIDGLGHIDTTVDAPLRAEALNPLAREPIREAIGTGVRAIDALLTCGRGQRIGVFGGSGVGKSTLLGMMARGTEADVVVLGLVGERGREVRSFLEHDLGPGGLERSVVVVSTSDSPPLTRQRAAYAATAIAEAFRDQGKHVLLMMDSITRFAMAQREVGLAAGEPPTAKGYPPSVFARLPGLLERAGALRGKGSITAFYTVLVEGDDHNEPIADAVRGILDGHIVLDRAIAERGRFPAINILKSVSRVMPGCNTPEEQDIVMRARGPLSTYEDMAELIRLGAYKAGTNPDVDAAIKLQPQLEAFLTQKKDESSTLAEGYAALDAIVGANSGKGS